MDKNRLTRIAVGLAMIAFAVLAFYAWEAKKRADEAEANVPFEAAKVLSFNLKKSGSLRITVGTGSVVANGADPGWGEWLPSSQKCKFPFSVDYSVDLTRMTSASYRWDATARTMLVEIPDVAVAAPNIDESRAECEKAEGWWVTRDASNRLRQLVSRRAEGVARAEAAKPANLEKARSDAHRAIEQLLSAPLAAAGLGQVSVIVRFPFERDGAIGERWNTSRTLQEVLGNQTGERPHP